MGCAVMKFPETLLIAAPAMGELGRPRDSQRVDLHAQQADSLLHAFERNGIGDAQALRVARAEFAALELRLDLRA